MMIQDLCVSSLRLSGGRRGADLRRMYCLPHETDPSNNILPCRKGCRVPDNTGRQDTKTPPCQARGKPDGQSRTTSRDRPLYIPVCCLCREAPFRHIPDIPALCRANASVPLFYAEARSGGHTIGLAADRPIPQDCSSATMPEMPGH